MPLTHIIIMVSIPIIMIIRRKDGSELEKYVPGPEDFERQEEPSADTEGAALLRARRVALAQELRLRR